MKTTKVAHLKRTAVIAVVLSSPLLDQQPSTLGVPGRVALEPIIHSETSMVRMIRQKEEDP